MTDAILFERLVGKTIIKLLKLQPESVNEILNNPNDYGFDVKEEKFFKISETQFKTVEDSHDLVKELNDGWQVERILTPGEYPGKFLIRKRSYLDYGTEADKND